MQYCGLLLLKLAVVLTTPSVNVSCKYVTQRELFCFIHAFSSAAARLCSSSERVRAGRKVTELTFCAEQACSNCDSFAVWLILLHFMYKVFVPRKSGSKFIANNSLLLTTLGQWVNDCLLCLTSWSTSCTCSNLIRNRTLLQKMSLRRCTKHCRCASHLYAIWIASRLRWSALHIYVDTSIFSGECTELESRG